MAATRVDRLLEDIEAGPAELAAVIREQAIAIAGLPLGPLARPSWRLLGMGSSRSAAADAAARLRSAGRDAHAETASASGGSPGGRDTLAVVISASGRTPEVLAAAERHRGTSFVLALTARTDSPLAAASEAVVPLAATYREEAGIATMTYRATVAALLALAGEDVPDPVATGLAAAPGALRELLDVRGAWLGAGASLLDGGRPVHVLGDGLRSGAVEQAALMLREAPRLPAVAFETGDWLHVGLYTLVPGDPVLLLAGSPADAEVIATVHGRGGRVVAVGAGEGEADLRIALPATAADPVVRALVEPAVAELLAAELWRRADARVVG